MVTLRLIVKVKYPNLSQDGIFTTVILVNDERVNTMLPERGPLVNAPRRAQAWLIGRKLLPAAWPRETLAEQCHRLGIDLRVSEREIE